MKVLLIVSLFFSFGLKAQDCSRILAKKQFQTAARLKMPSNFSLENLTKTIYLKNNLSQMIKTNRLIKEVKEKRLGAQTKSVLRSLSGIKNKKQVLEILDGIYNKKGFCAYKRTRKGKRYFSYLSISQIILGIKKDVFNIKKGPLINRSR